ncbi:YndJ family protein [Alkalihalobacillus sp. TS-13]|uniref:YndJ family protein n=1 Tax=Alkalihalobacillus sp. TS-13 TaxID=2842455 RepID=UPI001C8870EC|nr:YndJ family protein [Alkalihalobacillus sp. TS-13]
MKKKAVINAGIGFSLWVISLFAIELNLIEQLLLFAIYVTVPLTLTLTETVKRDGVLFKTYRAAFYLQLPMAVLAGLSFSMDPGVTAGFLSVGWLGFSILVFLYGISRLSARGTRPLEELSVDIGLIYFLLGGVWFTISRFGLEVMDFSMTIIQLTAIHFHFSAFVLPIFNGMLGRFLTRQQNVLSKTYKLATYGILAGPILIAIGITYSRLFEFLSVGIFVIALLIYCILFFTHVIPKISWLPRILVFLSTSTLILTLAFSFIYGFSRVLNVVIIPIPDMVLFHGIGNAFFVVFCGVVGWLLNTPKPHHNPYGVPFSRIHSGFYTGADFFDRNNLVDPTRHRNSLINTMSDYDRTGFGTRKLHPEIVSFYENTLNYDLESHTEWQSGFITFSKLYKAISRRIGQINLPLNGTDHIRMTGKIVPLQSDKDGRDDVRAWIRTTEDGEPIFAAAYSSHLHEGERYMNIAMPLLFGNMTGILKMDLIGETGLRLASFTKHRKGDEGIYYHCPLLTLKLPIEEHFHVWFDVGANTLRANHHMSLLGKPFLKIEYKISKIH